MFQAKGHEDMEMVKLGDIQVIGVTSVLDERLGVAREESFRVSGDSTKGRETSLQAQA